MWLIWNSMWIPILWKMISIQFGNTHIRIHIHKAHRHLFRTHTPFGSPNKTTKAYRQQFLNINTKFSIWHSFQSNLEYHFIWHSVWAFCMVFRTIFTTTIQFHMFISLALSLSWFAELCTGFIHRVFFHIMWWKTQCKLYHRLSSHK